MVASTNFQRLSEAFGGVGFAKSAPMPDVTTFAASRPESQAASAAITSEQFSLKAANRRGCDASHSRLSKLPLVVLRPKCWQDSRASVSYTHLTLPTSD